MHLVSSTPIGAKILQKILAALLIPTLLSLGSCVYPGGLPAGPTPSTAPPAQAATNPTPQLPVTGAVTQITPPPYTSGTHPPPTPPSPYPAPIQPAFPIRAAFFYPWFPEAWNQKHIDPYTNYHPSTGYYDSSDPAIIRQQISAMQYGNIQVGIASWWGQGSKTDERIPLLLQAAAESDFQWALYYENESLSDPSPAQIQNDLTYIRDHYAVSPNYLHIDGRFVIFVYAAPNDGCGMVDRWKQGNTVGAYVVLKVFPGYTRCASQPDGWHQYAPANPINAQKGESFTISPGFWLAGNPIRLPRSLDRWTSDIQSMVASGAPFQLITTFNEWGEGTAVESAQEWASPSGYGQYLDALHTNGVLATPTP